MIWNYLEFELADSLHHFPVNQGFRSPLLYLFTDETSNILRALLLQDGRIDYGEFVAMMQKGNVGLGRRTMRNSLNMSMRDAPGSQ